MAKNILIKFAQSCDSKQCRTEFKKDIIKGVTEAVATPHELDLKNRTVTCIYCGRVTKLGKTPKLEKEK